MSVRATRSRPFATLRRLLAKCMYTQPLRQHVSEELERRLLLAGAPTIDLVSSPHDDFHFLAGPSLPPVYNTYSLRVEGDVDSVTFRVGGMQFIDDNGADGWAAQFDMSQATTPESLTVTASGPGGTDSDTQDVNLLILPDWLTSPTTTFTATHDWTAGYLFNVEVNHLDQGFRTPATWLLTLPGSSDPIFDLANKHTGFLVNSTFTLTASAAGDVSSTDYQLQVLGDLLDQPFFDSTFTYSSSGSSTYERKFGSVEVNGSVAWSAGLTPHFARNLTLDGVGGFFWVDPTLTIKLPLGELPLASLGVADFSVGARIEFTFAKDPSVDHMIYLAPKVTAGGFGISRLEVFPSLSGAITGYAEGNVAAGAATVGVSLTGTLAQGLHVIDTDSAGLTISAPGSFTLHGTWYYQTLWGLGPSDEFDLFTWNVGEWDFLADHNTTAPSATVSPGSVALFTDCSATPATAEPDAFIVTVRYTNPGRPPHQAAGVLLDDAQTFPMSLVKGLPDDGVYSAKIMVPASGQHRYRFVFVDASGTYYTSDSTLLWGSHLSQLSGPAVTPTTGTDQAMFEYRVAYANSVASPPSSAAVVIDGTPHAMSLLSGHPALGTYLFRTTGDLLGAGTHSYYFIFSDAAGGAQTAVFGGPDVIPTPNVCSLRFNISNWGSTVDTQDYYIQYQLDDKPPVTLTPADIWGQGANVAYVADVAIPAHLSLHAFTRSYNHFFNGWDLSGTGISTQTVTTTTCSFDLTSAQAGGVVRIGTSWQWIPRDCEITGMVTSPRGPVAGSQLEISGSTGHATTITADDGTFAFTMPGGVPYTLTIHDDRFAGFAPAAFPIANLADSSGQNAFRFAAYSSDRTPPAVSFDATPDKYVTTSPTVTFSWTGTDDRTDAGKLRYMYRLIGLGSGTWSTLASVTSATWTLSNGVYRFEVEAEDEAGILSDTVTYAFAVSASPRATVVPDPDAQGIWLSFVSVAAPSTPIGGINDIVLRPTDAGCPGEEWVPLRLFSANGQTELGTIDYAADELALPAVFHDAGDGYCVWHLTNTPAQGYPQSYYIQWARRVRLGWDDNVFVSPVPQNSVADQGHLDAAGVFWQATVRVDNKGTNNEFVADRYVTLQAFSADGQRLADLTLDKALAEFTASGTPSIPSTPVYQGTIRDFALLGFYETDSEIRLVWRVDQKTSDFTDGQIYTSSIGGFVLARLSKSSHQLIGVPIRSPLQSGETWVAMAPDSSSGIWLTGTRSDGAIIVSHVDREGSITQLSEPLAERGTGSQPRVYPQRAPLISGNGQIWFLFYRRWRTDPIRDTRREVFFKILNPDGSVYVDERRLSPVSLPDASIGDDEYNVASAILDGSGRLWASLRHMRFGVYSYYWVAVNSDGSIFAGPTESPEPTMFYWSDRDGGIWMSDGVHFSLMDTDGHVLEQTDAGWPPNQSAGAVDALVDASGYTVFDRWHADTINLQWDPTAWLGTMEVLDVDEFGRNARVADLLTLIDTTPLSTTGPLGIQEFANPFAAGGSGAATLTLSQTSPLGGEILIAFAPRFAVPPVPNLLWEDVNAAVTWDGTVAGTQSYAVTRINAGAPFTLEYHLSLNTTWGDSDDIALPIQEVSEPADWTAGLHTSPLALATPSSVLPGQYVLLAKLDSHNDILESDEADNVRLVGDIAIVPLSEGDESAYYRLDGSYVDSSGHGNDGVQHGGVTFVLGVGRQGLAAHLDGVDDYIDLRSAGVGSNPSQLTQMVWIRTTQVSGPTDLPVVILSKRQDRWGPDWPTVMIERGYAEFCADDMNFIQRFPNQPADSRWVADGQWHLLTGVKNGDHYELYVDGALVAAGDYTHPDLAGSPLPMYLGHDIAWGTYFEGDIDEIRFWERPLSGGEIHTQYVLGLSLPWVQQAQIDATPRNTPVDSLSFTFNETVSGFDLSDLTLTRDAEPVPLDGLQLTSVDGRLWSLASLTTRTAAEGLYALNLNPTDSHIVDVYGNALVSPVTIVWDMDLTAPTVQIVPVTPDPKKEAVAAIQIHFSEAVDGFDLSHLILTRDGVPASLSSATLTSADHIHWSLANLVTLTSPLGSYQLDLALSDPPITDLAGNPLSAGATISWLRIADMASYYPLDGDFRDATIYGNDGTAYGNPIFVTGVDGIGQALRLDGEDDYVDLGTAGVGANPDALTQLAWVRTQTVRKDPGAVILTKRQENSDSWPTLLIRGPEDDAPSGYAVIRLDSSAPGANSIIESTQTVTDGKWHLLVGTVLGSSYCLYIDGVLCASGETSISGLNNLVHDMFLGHHGAWNSWYKGDIDEVRLWDFALTAEQIATIYESERPNPDIDVQAPGQPQNAHTLSFGDVELGEQSVVHLTVRNQGRGTLTVRSATGLGAPFVLTPVNSTSDRGDDWAIAPGASVILSVTYTPTALTTSSAIITIGSDDVDEPWYSITVTGTGVPHRYPEIGITGEGQPVACGGDEASPANGTDFGRVELADESSVHEFSITNTGTRELILTGTPPVILAGLDPTDFSIVTQPSSSRIEIGGAMLFSIRFSPHTAGFKAASVVILNDDPNEGYYTFSIGGIAYEPLQPQLVLSQHALSVPEGGTSQFSVQLSTCPLGPVDVKIGIGAESDSDLRLSTDALVFTPDDWDLPQVVVVEAADDVDSANGMATFQLSGPGLARQLLVATEIDDDPARLSPLITYTDSEDRLWIVDSSTADPVQVPLDPALGLRLYSPKWSADGSQIIFAAIGANRTTQLYVVNPDGTGLRRITDGVGNYVDPDPSPDGSQIVAHYVTGGMALVQLNGSGVTSIPAYGGMPSFSPDGSRIAYSNWGETYDSDLYIWDLSTHSATQLTHTAAGQGFIRPEWSPDGQHLICTLIDHNTNDASIVVLNAADGANMVSLTSDWTSFAEDSASFSADGTLIAFASNHDGSSDIWVMSATGDPATRRKVVNAAGTEWMPCIGPSLSMPISNPPTGRFLPVSPQLSNAAVDSVVIVFSAPVTGLDLSDVMLRRDGVHIPLAGATLETVTNRVWVIGSIGEMTASPGSYAVDIGTDNTDIVDSLGNPLSAVDGVTWQVDTIAPSVAIDQSPLQDDPDNAATVHFTVTFSEPVIGFAPGDVVVGGSAGAGIATISGDGMTFDVAVSGMSKPGTVTASIPAGAVQDAAGNQNQASQSNDNVITVGTASVTPVAHFSFDGTLLDLTGNGLNGTQHGGVTYVPGLHGQAVHLDGIDDFVDIGTAGLGSSPLWFTASAWVRTASTAADAAVLSKRQAPSDAWPTLMLTNGRAEIVPDAPDYTLNDRVYSTGSINDGQWHMVTAVRSGKHHLLYVDGSLVDDAFVDNAVSSTAGHMLIGRQAVWDTYFEGDIDEVTIWDRALTSQEVRIRYSEDALLNPTTGVVELPGSISGAEFLVKADSASSLVEVFQNNTSDGSPRFVLPQAELSEITIVSQGGSDSLVLEGGNYTLGNAFGSRTPAASLQVVGACSLEITAMQKLDRLSIGAGGHVRVGDGVAGISLFLGSLSIVDTGILDVAGGDVVIAYTDGSLAGEISEYIRNGALGLAPAILTSEQSGAASMSVAAVDNRTLHELRWNGVPISDGSDFSQLVVTPAYAGDTNLNRQVEESDYVNIIGNMSHAGTWIDGDLDADGLVTVSDFAIVTATLGVGASEIAGPLFSTPVASSLLSSATAVVLRDSRTPRMVSSHTSEALVPAAASTGVLDSVTLPARATPDVMGTSRIGAIHWRQIPVADGTFSVSSIGSRISNDEALVDSATQQLRYHESASFFGRIVIDVLSRSAGGSQSNGRPDTMLKASVPSIRPLDVPMLGLSRWAVRLPHKAWPFL